MPARLPACVLAVVSLLGAAALAAQGCGFDLPEPLSGEGGAVIAAGDAGAHGDATDAVPADAAIMDVLSSDVASVVDGQGVADTGLAAPQLARQPIALYTFKEASGTVVHDVSGIAPPLDLQLSSASPTLTWTGGGLSVAQGTLLESGAAAKVIDRCKATNAVTFEAWLTPASVQLLGRVVGIGAVSPSEESVLLQNGNAYHGHLTTTQETPYAQLAGPAGTATLALTHVVQARDAAGTWVMYVNGKQVVALATRGDLSTWRSADSVSIASPPDRSDSWVGSFFLVAIYDVALSSADVAHDFMIGPP